MTKDHAILLMVLISPLSFMVWQDSFFAGTAAFGALSVYVFQKGWK